MDHIKTPKLFSTSEGQYDDFVNLQHKVENVKLVDKLQTRRPNVGNLYITTSHLIFSNSERKQEIWVLHMHIGSLERLPLNTFGSPLRIRCKTFQCLTVIIPRERDCQDVYESLTKLSQPLNFEDLYAFHYTPSVEALYQRAGWQIYDAELEYSRMGVPNQYWCMTNINKNYELCDTYPQCLFVPCGASTPTIVGSARFRSRNRLPVLSYYHKSNQATITRCSQPLAGFSARCLEDEVMLKCILQANPNSKFLYVVDTRPKINALVNRAAGKGYENVSFYSYIKFIFLGIDNIHVMRSSLHKLIEACEMPDPSAGAFINALQGSGWLKHIKSIIDTSVFITTAIHDEHTSIMVHCSDGWDRTAQTISLASILLDPFYRTIQGFMVLLEKEWLAFGHKFTDRCGFLQVDLKEVSPIFTQFIDATWQVMQQFPSAFQYNERFLLTIHDHVFSCQFGTFIGNCEKDRLDLRLSERTYSLWGHVLHHIGDFINPRYRRDDSQMGILKPNTASQFIRFWRGMYMRFESWVHPRETVVDRLCVMKDQSSSLEDHLKLVTKRVAALKSMLGKGVVKQKNSNSSMFDSVVSSVSTLSDDLTITDDIVTTPTFLVDTAMTMGNGVELSDANSCNDEVLHSDYESGIDSSSLQTSQCTVASSVDSLTPARLTREVESVAIDWKSLRHVRHCPCSAQFEHFNRKYHCWRCGKIYCTRCMDKQVHLPGHNSSRAVPVCRICYKLTVCPS